MKESLKGRVIRVGALSGIVLRVNRSAVDKQGETIEYADSSVTVRLGGYADGGSTLKEIPLERIREHPDGLLTSTYSYSTNGTRKPRP